MHEGAAFPGNRFVGASWRPGDNADVLRRLRATTAGWAVSQGEGWLVASEHADALSQADSTVLALGRPRVFDRPASAFRDAAEVAATVRSRGVGDALDGMAAPFRAVWVDRTDGIVHATTDLFGLGHVFTASSAGFSALASSATLLAHVTGASSSAETLMGYAIFGCFLGRESPFTGVTKLPPGTCARLTGGRVEISSRATLSAATVPASVALRASVDAMLRAAPDAELELSGGLDSRLILACMPPEARRGRRAITIGVAADPSGDMQVAKGLAETEGLDWSILDVGGMAALDGPGLMSLLGRAVTAYDHMANPLDKAALISAGDGRSMEARFGGQNGEILRGFYYPGQSLNAQPTAALARSLIGLRLTANDCVGDSVFAPTVRADLRAAAEARMVGQLLSYGGTWGETLDRYYLDQRMQSWAGVSAGNRLLKHAPLYPFFDPDFVAAALATPAQEKMNSRAAYRLLVDIDARLAARPLDSGTVPAAEASRSAGPLSDLRLDLDRVVNRVRRKLAGAGRPTLGSQTVAQQWHRLALYEQLPVDRLARTGLFDEVALARVARGEWLPDRPTLGFLLVVAGLETCT